MRKSQGFLAVCTVPDVCKTPMGSSTPAVPYQVVGKLQDSLSTAPTVRFNGSAAIGIHRAYIPTTLGDSAGSAKGIKSGTVGAEIRPTSSSSSVRVEGYPVVREHDTCSMNSGNTVGKYVCPPSPGSASARLANPPSPAPNTPGMLELAASYWQRYSSAVHQTGQTMVEVGDTVGLAGNGITVAGLGIGLVTGVTGAGAVAGGGIAAGGRVVAGAGYATSATGEGVQALASALDAAAEWVQTQEIKVSLNDVVVYMGGHLLDRATGKIPKVARTTKATQKAAGKTPAKAAEKKAGAPTANTGSGGRGGKGDNLHIDDGKVNKYGIPCLVGSFRAIKNECSKYGGEAHHIIKDSLVRVTRRDIHERQKKVRYSTVRAFMMVQLSAYGVNKEMMRLNIILLINSILKSKKKALQVKNLERCHSIGPS